MPFVTSSFDAAYAIEATCHASSLSKVYTEISRVLKPHSPYGIIEWVLTPEFDPSNPSHLAIRNRIERGAGVANLDTVTSARSALHLAGLKINHEEDYIHHWETHLRYPHGTTPNSTPFSFSTPEGKPTTSPSQILIPFSSSPLPLEAPPPTRPITPFPSLKHPHLLPRPFYYPLLGSTSLSATREDHILTRRMSPLPRFCNYWLVRCLEMVRLAPRGCTDAMDTLGYCVDGCAEGGREGVFSPSWWFVGVNGGEDGEGDREGGSDGLGD